MDVSDAELPCCGWSTLEDVIISSEKIEKEGKTRTPLQGYISGTEHVTFHRISDSGSRIHLLGVKCPHSPISSGSRYVGKASGHRKMTRR